MARRPILSETATRCQRAAALSIMTGGLLMVNAAANIWSGQIVDLVLLVSSILAVLLGFPLVVWVARAERIEDERDRLIALRGIQAMAAAMSVGLLLLVVASGLRGPVPGGAQSLMALLGLSFIVAGAASLYYYRRGV